MIIAILIGAICAMGIALLLRRFIFNLFPEIKEEREARRITNEEKKRKRQEFFTNIAARINAFLPVKNTDKVEYRDELARAGLQISPETFHGFSLMSAIAGLIVGIVIAVLAASLNPILRVLIVLILFALGVVTPRFVLSMRARKRRSRLESDLSSTLELLAVTVKAGYPLESGIKLVANIGDGELAKEFVQVDYEVSLLGMNMDESLKRMATRCGTPAISSFCSAIIQAHRQGTSISRILQAQAKIARDAYYTATMTKISSLTNKMIPIVTLVFLPLIFVVALTPNLIKTIETLSGTIM